MVSPNLMYMRLPVIQMAKSQECYHDNSGSQVDYYNLPVTNM